MVAVGRRQAQLEEHVLDVRADRPLSDHQGLGDGVVVAPFGQPPPRTRRTSSSTRSAPWRSGWRVPHDSERAAGRERPAAKRSPIRRWVAASGWSWSGSGGPARSASPKTARPSRQCRFGSWAARCFTMRLSSSQMTVRASLPAACSAGSPAARNQTFPSRRPSRSGRLGPGVSSWMGHRMGGRPGAACSGGPRGWCRGNRAPPG